MKPGDLQKDCILSFYHEFTWSVICYGLLVYGKAARTLKKLKWHRGELSELISSKKFDSLHETLRETELNTYLE